jgi:hypothetical protein
MSQACPSFLQLTVLCMSTRKWCIPRLQTRIYHDFHGFSLSHDNLVNIGHMNEHVHVRSWIRSLMKDSEVWVLVLQHKQFMNGNHKLLPRKLLRLHYRLLMNLTEGKKIFLDFSSWLKIILWDSLLFFLLWNETPCCVDMSLAFRKRRQHIL